MRFAFVASDRPISVLAQSIGELVNGAVEERDGLNLGGGQYFLIRLVDGELVVCWSKNYEDPPDPRFRYCMYVHKGADGLLDVASGHLGREGMEVCIA